MKKNLTVPDNKKKKVQVNRNRIENKYYRKIILFILLSVIIISKYPLFFSCSGKTVPEIENNDTREKAGKIELNKEIKGTISTLKDTDFFLFDLRNKKNDIYSIRVKELKNIENSSMILTLYNQDGVYKQVNDFRVYDYNKDKFDTSGEYESFENINLGGERYWLRVSMEFPYKKKIKEFKKAVYYLKIILSSFINNFEKEPNDKNVDADTLTIGEEKKGLFNPGWNIYNNRRYKSVGEGKFIEEDWYLLNLEIDKPSIIGLKITPVPDVDAVLEIWDEFAGVKIKSIDNYSRDESEEYINFGVERSKKLYIVVKSKFMQYNKRVPYKLTTFLNDYDNRTEFEPNDIISQSSLIHFNSSILGTISPRGDYDWYSFTVPPNSDDQVKIILKPVRNIDTVIELRDRIGEKIISIDNMGKEESEILSNINLEPGNYHIIIRGKKKEQNSKDTYTMILQSSSIENCEIEMNNTMEEATEVHINKDMEGFISPKGDIDYYTFTLRNTRDINISLIPVPNIDFIMTLINENRKKRVIDSNGSGAGENLNTMLEPGNYYVEIKEKTGNKFNYANRYMLSIRK